jgi:IS5 family transposase
MKQMSLASTGLERVTKRTRKREFLDEMNLVIPWSELLSLIAPHAPAGKTGRPPFATEVMLRTHLLQQFFGHSDPGMEEALHDIPLYQAFAHLDAGMSRLPDESTILRFRHMLEAHGLGQQILTTVNAQLKTKPSHALRDKLEKLKASTRAKVEHPFWVIKCQFGQRKTRYRGLAKNASQLLVMFALSNLWMVRKRILQGLQA